MPKPPVLRYLHISDLHFRNGGKVRENDQEAVTDSLLKAIQEYIITEPLDFIVITGDIAFSGQREEYELAQTFCEQLLEMTEVDKSRLYLVAGNHDLLRRHVTKTQQRLYRFDDQDEISEFLADGEQRPLLMKKFDEFHRFAEQVMGRRHYNEQTWHLHEAITLQKSGQPFRLNLLGLNSALFAGYDGDDKQQLALGNYQVDPALKQLDEDAPLSIGFFHHPFSCFHQTDLPVQNRLRHELDLILTGHLHTPANAVEQNGAGLATIIGAGAAYETRTSQNSFNRVSINLSSGKGVVELWKYVPGHHCWNRDVDTNPHHPKGLFEFEVAAIRDQPMTESPTLQIAAQTTNTAGAPVKNGKAKSHFIHDYLLPNNFTGRVDEQQRLEALLQGKADPVNGSHASVVSIQALGGMGKSALARQLFDTLYKSDKSPYQQLIWYSFYESRSSDEAEGFAEIIQAMGQTPDRGEQQGIAAAERLRRQLCLALDNSATLLVLDGLEVIQHSTDVNSPRFSNIRDNYRQTAQLLRHFCNQDTSRALVTSRLQLRELTGASGFVELELKIFSDTEAADLLQRIGVKGSREELEQCANPFAGHPLALKAAGIFMHKRGIAAKDVEKLIGNPRLFKSSTEGERVTKIVDAHRHNLSEEQQYFLKMLSIHPRSVAVSQRSALLHPDVAEWSEEQIEDELVQPLIDFGLIERIDGEAENHYSAHPLMKLAFSTWLDAEGTRRAHSEWADAAKGSPALGGAPMQARSLEALQPWLDVVEHYLDAGEFEDAWGIWRGRGVDDRLDDLGYASLLLALGQKFEQALIAGHWQAEPGERVWLYQYLGQACNGLNRQQEMLDYIKRQYAAAQEKGRAEDIVEDGAILAQSYLNLGKVAQARQQLLEIQPRVEGLSTGHVKAICLSAEAKVELFAGNYAAAQPLYDAALKRDTGRNAILQRYFLGESQLRNDQLQAAETSLQQALQQAKQARIPQLIPEILQNLSWLALKQHDLTTARSLTNQRIKMRQEMGLPSEDDGLLLVQEGRHAEALALAASHISTPGDEKLDKNNEIEALLVTAQAHHGLEDAEQAKAALQRAQALMEQTGCWRMKDWLAETEALLAVE